jgi:hypothetical protein
VLLVSILDQKKNLLLLLNTRQGEAMLIKDLLDCYFTFFIKD